MRRISLLPLLALSALAAVPPLACANSSNGTHNILSVILHDSGNVIVALDGHSNTEGCASAGSENSVVISNKNANFKLFYAMALLAESEGKPVAAWVNGCTDVWGSGSLVVPTVTRLDLAR